MTEHDPHDPVADCDCHQCAVVERNRLRQEVTMLRQEYAADTVEIAKLNAMLDEQRGEIGRLRQEVSMLRKKFAADMAEIARLTDKLAEIVWVQECTS